MENFLQKIISDKTQEVAKRKAAAPIERLKENLPETVRNFSKALLSSGLSIIAEIKKASPSRGVIREDFDFMKIAGIYETGGVSAISVLTEEKYFQGSLPIMKQISSVAKVPVLRKDFILDEYQIYEARVNGADALLLISAILQKETLAHLLELTHSLGMSALVEVHDPEDTEKALSVGAKIIGINNRDLRTFKTDLKVTSEIKKLIPQKGHIVVSESGINTREDALALKELRVDAILVGEALMREEDISSKLKEFLV